MKTIIEINDVDIEEIQCFVNDLVGKALDLGVNEEIIEEILEEAFLSTKFYIHRKLDEFMVCCSSSYEITNSNTCGFSSIQHPTKNYYETK